MTRALPPWVHSHARARAEEEARRYATMTPSERLRCYLEVNAMAAVLFGMNDRAAAVAETRDELPAESVALLRRLRERRRAG